MHSIHPVLLLGTVLICACSGSGSNPIVPGPPPALPACATAPAAGTAQAPALATNILFIVTEDQGMQLGAIGTAGLLTPNMDGLAAEGVLLTNAHVTLATCTGSKSSIFTGFYNHSSGATGNVNEFVGSAQELAALAANDPAYAWFNKPDSPYNRNRIRADIPTLIEILRDAGYYTGLHNKFHLSPHSKFPYDQWDSRNSSNLQVSEFIAQAASTGKPWFLTHVIGTSHRPYPDYDDPGTVRTVDPAAVSPPAHLPLTSVIRKDWAEYLAAIEKADQRVGQVLQALQNSGTAGNTLVVFMGDHGPSYHRGKLTTYGFGLRAPVIFRGPGVPAGTVQPALFSNVDMMATMLDFLGHPAPPTQGVSFRALLTAGSSTTPRHCVVGESSSDRSIFDGRYRLIETPLPADTNMPADNRDFDPWRNRVYSHILDNATTPGFELAYRLLDLADAALPTFDRPAFELYDDSADPWEVEDLAADPLLGSERQRLADLLDVWRAQTTDTPR